MIYSSSGTSTHQGGEPPVRPSIVLVVDDDPAVRGVAGKVLKRSGYEVIEAGGGDEALRVLRERSGRVDLLLTDVVMPGMGGAELHQRVEAEYPSVGILFMSGYTDDRTLVSGAGDVPFLPKPFDFRSLTRSVSEALGRRDG